MFEKIVDIITKHASCDKSAISRDTSLITDLNLNSITVFKIILELEEEFEIEFQEEDIFQLTTVGDIENYIKGLLE